MKANQKVHSKCELQSAICRGNAIKTVVFTPHTGAPRRKLKACMACLALLSRSGIKFKNV